MNIDQLNLESLAAFLGGSLGTLVIKGAIDLYLKDVDHKRQLKTLTYQRKLQVAEDTIAFYSHYRYNVIQMGSAITILRDFSEDLSKGDDEEDIDLSGLQLQLSNVAETVKAMFSGYQNILSVNLYFDFSKAQYFKLQNLTTLNVGIAKARALDHNIEFWVNASNLEYKRGNKDLGDQFYQNALQYIPKYVSQLDIILSGLEKDAKGADEVLRLVKEQMETY